MMRINETLTSFEEYSYPLASERLIELLGDDELELPSGTERLADVFDRTRTESFDSPDDVRLTFLAALDSDAIGRKGYSDRDPPTVGEPRPDQDTL